MLCEPFLDQKRSKVRTYTLLIFRSFSLLSQLGATFDLRMFCEDCIILLLESLITSEGEQRCLQSQ